jgi:hypothetical protein
MAHTALTVLAPIRDGTDLETLRCVLDDVGDSVYENSSEGSYIRMRSIPELHFLRFALVKDPDRGPDCVRLLFAAVIDGDDKAGFFDRLRAATNDTDGIWGNCLEYPGEDGFAEFMCSRNIEPAAFYTAFKDQRVQDVNRYGRVRQRIEKLLDERVDGNALYARFRRRYLSLSGRLLLAGAATKRFLKVGPSLLFTSWDGVRLSRRHRFKTVWSGMCQVVSGLDRYLVWRLFNRVFGNRDVRVTGLLSEAKINKVELDFPPDQMLSVLPQAVEHPLLEDRVTQNQLTLITPITTEEGANRLGATLGVVDNYARVWAEAGTLLGMSTIHLVRWMPIDYVDGVPRRFLMLSDYDHSWDAYIEEFVEMIRTGMDAMWSSVNDDEGHGYLKYGSLDVAAFKQFLRAHQVNASVFYSAYPNQTVLNLREDRELFRGLNEYSSESRLLRIFERRHRNLYR